MSTAVSGADVPAALRSVRRSLRWQGRRAVVTSVLGVLALVGLPCSFVPQALRDHRLVEDGAVVEAVVRSTDVRGLRHTRLTAVVQPDTGPPAYVDRLFGQRPVPGDRLLVVLDPQDPDRALLARSASDLRVDLRLDLAEALGSGLVGWLFVTGWGTFGLAERVVREDLAAALDRAGTAGPGALAVPFEVCRTGFPLAPGTSLRERYRAKRCSHDELVLSLADGRTVSGRWAEGRRLVKGGRGLAVGNVSPGGRAVLVVDGRVLWPDTCRLQVRPPSTTGRPRGGDGPRAVDAR